MATLEEVSDRLVQPAKDLSDWNYPLSKDLEKYSTAVVETEDINYSNAGLIIENSANVHVRRVEYLLQDVICLGQSLVDHEAAVEATKNPKESRNRKIVVDFGDFEPIDFAQYVGKNNNIKARNGINNSVKLLSQRFPQLENVSRSSLPIQVYDVHGEVVGKKYDFRCNQYSTASGMLVEHLTPDDFPDVSSANGSATTPLECEESSVAFDTITEQCDSGNEDDTEIHESLSGVENCDVSNVVQDKDTDIFDTSFASYADSGLDISVPSPDIINTRRESTLSGDDEIPWNSTQSRAGSSLSIGDVNSLVERNSEPLDPVTPDESSGQTTTIEKTDEFSQFDSLLGNRNVNENENTVARANTDDKESSEEDKIIYSQNTRSKRIKNVIDSVTDLNSKPWEPIPFNSVPDKIPTSRAEFKLPCPISLLKFKERSRKRKLYARKKRSLASFLTNEFESPRKKMTMYSPTSQLFLPYTEETVDEFQRTFELHFKNRPNTLDYEAVTSGSKNLLGYRKTVPKADRETIAPIRSNTDEEFRDQADVDAFNYEAVTDISMNLLASKSNNSLFYGDTSTNRPAETNDEHVEPDIDDFSTLETIDHTMESIIDDFPMSDTPESAANSERPLTLTPLPSYHSRIEHSVREIYDSSDVRTAQEEAVARWHERIKPKLKEAERRPPFDMSQYSARVIQNLQAMEDNKIEFKEMVQQQMAEPAEVARYFLASLQLANTYNVHIDTGPDVEGNLTLVLLDKDRSSNK